MSYTFPLKSGKWRGELDLGEEKLPFNFHLTIMSEDKYRFDIQNGEEVIYSEVFVPQGDSFIVRMPIFDSEFHLAATHQGKKLVGYWWNKARKTKNKIPFIAEAETKYRFVEEQSKDSLQTHDFSGKYEVTFGLHDKDAKPYPAIGEFQQKKNIVTGTFLTETGDYRYLQGVSDGIKLKLSCFDGSHAFLFTGEHDLGGKADQILNGCFYSGTHHKERWEAIRIPPSQSVTPLARPDTLTFLKKGAGKLAFTFPNLAKNPVSLSDERYKNKVTIVQILGSWCPNCMDETRYLAKLYHENKDKGLEVIGLCYERSENFDEAAENVTRLKNACYAEYEFLIAGVSDKTEAAKTLPMLNAIIAYPTTLVIDKKGVVRKIHTGFSGPATGKHYQDFVEEMQVFLEGLMKE
jgi:peroxiredoxin